VRRHNLVMVGLALLAALGLSACSAGIRQSSAASDEDAGQVHVPPPQSSTYSTQAGDTLISIAARPDVYGDPDLWPLLQDANAEILSGKSADSPLNADMALEVPRGSTPDALESARERAREYAAEQKALAAAEVEPAVTPSPTPSKHKGGGEKGAEAARRRQAEREAKEAAAVPEAAVQMTAVASPVAPAPATPSQPSRMLPLYVLLLLVLGALAAVFYVFFKRDKQDFD
jgi:hypothetical protein